MSKGDDIERRLVEFGVGVLRLCSALPANVEAAHIAGQLLRCGPSVAPNYGEARGAETKKDFTHKLGVVLKELNESAIWLEILRRSGIAEETVLTPLQSECTQLARIIMASIRTARGLRKKEEPKSLVNDR